MTVSEFIKNHENASNEAILSVLGKDNFIAVSVAIFETVKRKLDGKPFLDALSSISSRTDTFWKPYTVGDLATAAYFMLSGEEYTGDSAEVDYLIRQKMIT